MRKSDDEIAPEAVLAFRVFLDRKPDPNRLPRYKNVQELNRALANSEEFLNSHRAKKAPLGWPLAQVFVSKAARAIYCPIGKNACTSLKSEVTRTAGLLHTNYILRDVHFITDHVRTGMQLSDYTEDQVQRLITAKQYFKFAVLRDPADRLLSAYIEKFVMGRMEAANIHHTKTVVVPVQAEESISPPDYSRGITFRQFATFVGQANLKTLDPHWRPQASYLEGIEYDRLFSIDQLDEVMDILEERSDVSLTRQPRNVTGSGRGIDVKGAADMLPAQIVRSPRISKESFFDVAVRTLVETTFANDYLLFKQTKD